jgi:molybdopterin biosynthesis enzyme
MLTGKIRDSNRPSLVSLYGSLIGASNVMDLGIAGDAIGVQAFSELISSALDRWELAFIPHDDDEVVTRTEERE